jgi:hypothetical protein
MTGFWIALERHSNFQVLTNQTACASGTMFAAHLFGPDRNKGGFCCHGLVFGNQGIFYGKAGIAKAHRTVSKTSRPDKA